MEKNRGKTTKTCQLMKTLRSGESFYLEDTAQKATAYSNMIGVPITTKNCLIIEGYKTSTPKIRKIIKVTIV